jgi:hypothetical protein
MSATMFKDGISKVVHNREIRAAKEAGWTFSPDEAKVKLKPRKKITKDKVSVTEVEIIKPTITNVDLSGPEDLNKEGD